MAKMTINGFDELNQLLDRLSAPEEMAIKAVNAAAPIVENAMKAQIARAANRKDARGHPYSTGALAASIKATEAKENAYGIYSVVKPSGTDARGTSNAQKLAYLENGVRSHGQAPRPVRSVAVAACKSEAIAVMEQVINQEVEQI